MRNYTIAVLLVFLIAGAAVSQSFYANQRIQDATIFERNFEFSTNITSSSPSSGPCLNIYRASESTFGTGGCAVTGATDSTEAFTATGPMTLTSIAVGISDTLTGTADTMGCRVCISTDEGATCETATQIELPPEDGTAIEGSYDVARFSLDLEAGETWHIVGLDGPYSEGTGAGDCGTNAVSGRIRVGGYHRW